VPELLCQDEPAETEDVQRQADPQGVLVAKPVSQDAQDQTLQDGGDDANGHAGVSDPRFGPVEAVDHIKAEHGEHVRAAEGCSERQHKEGMIGSVMPQPSIS
jgi:hypothetical protein